MESVAFEVDRANIGRRRSLMDDERTAAALCIRWNRTFIGRRLPLRICPAYRHTGNYWLYSDQQLLATDVAQGLADSVERGFAVFTVEEFLGWLTLLKMCIKEPSAIPSGRRATPGAVIDLNPSGEAPPIPPSSERIVTLLLCPGYGARGNWMSKSRAVEGWPADPSCERAAGGRWRRR